MMPPDPADVEFKDFVVDQLRELHDVAARRMFGGWGLYRGGVFFGIVSKGQMFVKTDTAFRKLFTARGMGPFQPTPKITLKTYYEVPIDVLEDSAALGEWAHRAVSCRLADADD